MALKAKLYTLSGLETELKRDRRTLGKLLSSVKPDGKCGGREAWFIKTALDALNEQTDNLNPAAEKARLDKARADLAELDLAERSGRLVDAARIEATWAAALTELRTRLLAIPSTTAPRVTPKMTAAEVEALIREQIDDALGAISGADLVEDADQDTGISGAGWRAAPGTVEAEAFTEA